MKLAPIVLFVYNRPWHTRQTLEALEANTLASQSDLFIYADGPKENCNIEDMEHIREVRSIIKEKQWCGKVTITESDINKGLARSIVNGVTEIVSEFKRVIVLEDDIVTSPGFLQYMNDALELYENNHKVMHISGFMFPMGIDMPETFFYNVTTCWGWATWQRAWKFYEHDAYELKRRLYLQGRLAKYSLNFTSDSLDQLERNIEGKLNTWAIRWYTSVFLQKGYCLNPCPSLVRNVGMDGTGEHCDSSSFHQEVPMTEYIAVKAIALNESGKARKAMEKLYEIRKRTFLEKYLLWKHSFKVYLFPKKFINT